MRKLLSSCMLTLCCSVLPLQTVLAFDANVIWSDIADYSYSGGGVQEGIEAAEGFGVTTNVRALIVKILFTVFTFLGILAVLIIVIAGVYLIIGGGEDETRQKVKNMILYVLIGLILILMAGALVQFFVEVAEGA